MLFLYSIAVKLISHKQSIEEENLLKQKLLSIDIWNNLLVNTFLGALIAGLFFAALFFCLGMVIASIYKQYSYKVHKIYFFDLLGASCGCIAGVIMLNFIQVSSILLLISICLFLIAFFILQDENKKSFSIISNRVFLIIVIATMIFNVNTGFFELTLNPHILAHDWEIEKKCEELWHRWNSYSRISLIRVNNQQLFSINKALGHALLVPFIPKQPYRFELFNGFSPATIPFLLDTSQDILFLFAGAGKDMVEAFSYSKGVSNITGVELNPIIVEKAKSLPEFNLNAFFAKKNVEMIVAEGRSYLEATDKKFDSIILSWSGASFAQYLDVPQFTGEYLYTKEAFVSYINHLKPDGMLGIICFNKIKNIAMAKEAFKEIGDEKFFNKLIVFAERKDVISGQAKRKLIHPMHTVLKVVIKKSGFSKEQVELIQNNLSKMDMILLYTPYFTHEDFQVIENLVQADNTEDFLQKLSKKLRLNLMFSTDDKPFCENIILSRDIFSKDFWSLFNNGQIPESWSNKGLNKNYNLEQLKMFLVMAYFCVFIIFMGGIFLIIPLCMTKKHIFNSSYLKILAYFAILGLGFICAEISIMRIFTLFLGNPIYSFSIILSTLLVATGLGSILSQKLLIKKYLNIKKMSVVCFLALLTYFLFLSQLNKYFLHFSFSLKLLITFISIFPLGTCLGVFFPQGLKLVYSNNKELIPWVWAVNGFMSIAGSVFSVFLAITFGFSFFLLISAFLYLSIIFLNIENL
ncbi:MAG: hypothetical protein ABIG64_03705 [Candidatus Omnitrophota bacterium]